MSGRGAQGELSACGAEQGQGELAAVGGELGFFFFCVGGLASELLPPYRGDARLFGGLGRSRDLVAQKHGAQNDTVAMEPKTKTCVTPAL